jgi:hypothetical protein
MEVIASFACLILLAILIVLIDVARTARQLRGDASLMRSIVEHGLHYFMFDRHGSHFFGSIPPVDCGFCVWVFRRGNWQIEGNYCAEGYEPGPPPSRAGVIEGYAVRQLAVKKRRG